MNTLKEKNEAEELLKILASMNDSEKKNLLIFMQGFQYAKSCEK